MRKIMKIALEQEQIDIKSQYKRFDGYEIHLYGDDRDNFSLSKQLNKPIITVHWPIKRCDVYDVCNEFNSPYAGKVFNLCIENDAGLVLHAETGLTRLLTNPNLDTFCEKIKELGISLHIENCYNMVGAIEGLKVMNYLKQHINDNKVYPLLDTCHLIMSGMSFKFAEMSFYETIDAYTSENFKIHLNDCIGSGEKETGGIHGTNFYANQYLLSNILWKLHELKKKRPDILIDFILEVDEDDYNYPTNADKLAKDIDKYWQEFQNEK